MKKDFAKKKFAVKQSETTSSRRRLWAFSICLIVMLIFGVAFFAYQPKEASLVSPVISTTISSFYLRIHNWLTEHKTRLHENLVSVKRIAVNKKVTKPEIHFEFYTTLQNMQVTLPEADKSLTAAPTVSVVHNNTSAGINNRVNLASNPAIHSAKVASGKKIENKQAIFDAEQLQTALKNEFNHVKMQSSEPISHQYIVQMGVFKNPAGAEKFRASFAKSGFVTKIVKIRITGKNAYSVQIGPFLNKNQAVLAQRQLQKKNVNGIIRKL